MTATIRAFFLAPLMRELVCSGVPVDSILRKHRLSAAQLTSLYERVPLKEYVALAEEAAVRLKRPLLGLELGAQFKLADLGPFYAMFVFAEDLASALSSLSRFQSAWQTDTTMEFVRGARSSECRYQIQDREIWPRQQDAEFSMASFTAFIRQLTGSHWCPVAVEFEHDVGRRLAKLQEYFGSPVVGQRGSSRLIIDNECLNKKLRWQFEPGSQDVLPILEKHLLSLLAPAAANTSFTSRVNSFIERNLGRSNVSMDAVAVELKVSARSLRRHLTDENTSFRDLLQARRKVLFEEVARHSGQRLAVVASRLGYSDVAVLSRAFKSWNGVSPRAHSKKKR